MNITVSSTSTDPLTPFVPTPDKPWNARRVAHLYRRLGFGVSWSQIQHGLQKTPDALVDELFDTAANLAQPSPPVWANYTVVEYEGNNSLKEAHRRELRHRWLTDMLQEGVRAQMAFFWHNHFVTDLLVYGCNSFLWNYYALLHQYAFGNFRDFTVQMGKNGAMLLYLNGNLNQMGAPNENYARELMELFTMGEGNGYTQLDVVEMARALTGWRADMNECTPAYFDPARFDGGSKTIFGKTGNFGFDEAHMLIFSERPDQVAHFVPRKIYRHFVHPTPDAQVLDGLAQTFRDNDWEILPVLKQLFKSEHFFEEKFLSTRIKGPVEALVGILKMADARYPDHFPEEWWDIIHFRSYRLGQYMLQPPNVAGWKEHRYWISESALTTRWNFFTVTASMLLQSDSLRENLRQIARDLTNDSRDPVVITAALVEYFLGQDLEAIYRDAAVAYFKSGVPENYFLNGSWNLSWSQAPDQIVNLLSYLVRLPEFQLS